ncbi:MAG: hypothetical protein A3H91_10955 [Gammaproteobacteria bacterium RIFCSPLOWO2_02_FULL_61_13]|nr:MAG: hypothetical protein A3H91_10955 [Gammaproteobacteria bacterium RIFCSPLOWO2_02_FULL_61_13]
MKPARATLMLLVIALFSVAAVAEETATESASGEVMQKCKYPTRPDIPNGRDATEEEMIGAQKVLKDYLAGGDGYLACLDQVSQGWGETATEEQKAVIVIFHNRMVDEMQSTADLFNQSVRAFKGKRGT